MFYMAGLPTTPSYRSQRSNEMELGVSMSFESHYNNSEGTQANASFFCRHINTPPGTIEENHAHWETVQSCLCSGGCGTLLEVRTYIFFFFLVQELQLVPTSLRSACALFRPQFAVSLLALSFNQLQEALHFHTMLWPKLRGSAVLVPRHSPKLMSAFGCLWIFGISQPVLSW